MTGFYWLVSYPRSGSTWLALALCSMHRGGSPVEFAAGTMLFPQAAARDTFDRALGIESSDLTPDEDERLRPRLYETLARQADEPMIRRIHSAFVHTSAGEPLFPPALTLGAVYLVRDPRDVALSYAHYMNRDIDFMIEAMRNPGAAIGAPPGALSPLLRQRLLTWSDHVRSWLDAGLRLLLVRYEDLLANPAGVLSSVAAFLGWNTAPEVIAAAVETTQFSRLRSAEQKHGFESSARRPGPFFRRGLAGGWRTGLTPEQIRQLEHDHGPAMARVGYAV
ncbi:MAG: sulfotransferase domain-containing protein [Bryobacteraceae bacterium]